MFPGVNPRQMKKMMQRMGIQQKDISATEVIIKTQDKELVFTNPQVAKVNMMGQETYQIIGTPEERAVETKPEINEEDIETVAQQANVSSEKAKEALEKHKGDLAAAIMDLNPEE